MTPSRSCHEWQECHPSLIFCQTCARMAACRVGAVKAVQTVAVIVQDDAEPFGLGSLVEVWGEPEHPEDRHARLRLPGLHAAPGPGQGPLRLRPVRRARPGGDRGRRPGLPVAAPRLPQPRPGRDRGDQGGRRPRRDPLRALLRRLRARRGGAARRPRVHDALALHRPLEQMYPEAKVEPDVLYCHDGNILTGAGSAAGIDASLHLMRDLYGARVAATVARRIVVPPHRDGGQAQFIERAVPDCDSRDLRTAAGVDHAEPRRGPRRRRPWPASRCMSPRTFARRFRAETGATPALLGHRSSACRPPRSCSSSPTTPSSGSPTRSASATPPPCGTTSPACAASRPQQYRRTFAGRTAS